MKCLQLILPHLLLKDLAKMIRRYFFNFVVWMFISTGVFVAGFQEMRIQKNLERLTRPIQLFNPGMLLNAMPPRPEWDIVQSLDRHRFFYVISQSIGAWVGRGENCCTFSLPNNRYVFKFIRFDIKKKKRGLVSWVVQVFHKKKLARRVRRALYSAKIGVEELSEQTGIVYAHLNPTDSFLPSIIVRDFYGQECRIYADQVSFIVQRKAVPFIQKISALMSRGDIEEAKKHIDHALNLCVSTARKGYMQKDGFNIGFVEDRAIFMDVWHFKRMERCSLFQRISYDARETFRPMESWLVSTYPVLGEYYQEAFKSLLADIQNTDDSRKIFQS